MRGAAKELREVTGHRRNKISILNAAHTQCDLVCAWILVLNPCEIRALNIPRQQLGSEQRLQLSFGASVLLADEPNLPFSPKLGWALAPAKESQLVFGSWTRCLTNRA